MLPHLKSKPFTDTLVQEIGKIAKDYATVGLQPIGSYK